MRLLPRIKRSDPARPRVEPTVTWPKRAPVKVSYSALSTFLGKPTEPTTSASPYTFPTYRKGVLPNGRTEMAMDEADNAIIVDAWDFQNAVHGMWSEGIGFMGYPYLAELSQRAEFRRASEVIAEEMTRKWISLKATGENDKTEKVKRLEAKLDQFRVRDIFRSALEHDGFFGIGMIFMDFGDDNAEELRARLPIDAVKIGRGRLQGFKVIDPTWIAPNRYDARDPTSPAFYKPQTWFVMGREIHASRFLTLISRPLPDILKPAYNFGGLSLSQMMKPYVDNWLRTRQSISDLINSFTVFVLSTNLDGLLNDGGGQDEAKRLRAFADMRNNRGLLVINNGTDNTEALTNISAPLGTLDHLQAQSQEHICSVIAVPLVKYLGVTPSGLNASADGEIRVYYDGIKARQEKVCSDHVRTVLEVLQFDEFGEVDPEIDFEWVPLWELDESGAATVRKTEVDTDAVLIELGAIDADEVRRRVAAEPDSPYSGLDLSKPAPGPPAMGPGGEIPTESPLDGEDSGGQAFVDALLGGDDASEQIFMEALRGGGLSDTTAAAMLEALRGDAEADPTGKLLLDALRGAPNDDPAQVILDCLRGRDDFATTVVDALAQ